MAAQSDRSADVKCCLVLGFVLDKDNKAQTILLQRLQGLHIVLQHPSSFMLASAGVCRSSQCLVQRAAEARVRDCERRSGALDTCVLIQCLGGSHSVPEAKVMYEQLVSVFGVNPRLILCEDRSNTTAQNLLFTHRLLSDTLLAANKDSPQTARCTLYLVTSDFHMERAAKMASTVFAEEQGFRVVHQLVASGLQGQALDAQARNEKAAMAHCGRHLEEGRARLERGDGKAPLLAQLALEWRQKRSEQLRQMWEDARHKLDYLVRNIAGKCTTIGRSPCCSRADVPVNERVRMRTFMAKTQAAVNRHITRRVFLIRHAQVRLFHADTADTVMPAL